MDSADCIECDRPVRARQEGLQCDGCDRWQHRRCNTGISRSVYKATVRGDPEGLQSWYCDNCPRPGMGPATPTLRERPATPILRERPATPILRERPATPILSEGPATPTWSEGPATPTLSEGPATPTLSEGPATSTWSEGPATPTWSEGPATPTWSEGPATPTWREGPATPTLRERPATPTLRDGPATPQHLQWSPLRSARKGPVMTDETSSSETRSSSEESDDTDDTDDQRSLRTFRPLFLPLCPRRFRWSSPAPASDATFIVEHTNQAHMSDVQSPRHMDKAFLIDDSDDSSEDDTFWFPGMRTSPFLEEETRYEIIENGTSRGRRKLVSSDGYSYTVKNSSTRTTTWKCSVRNRTVNCSALVIQRGQSFTRGLNDHIHIANHFLANKLKIMSRVKSRAMADGHQSAASIVRAVLQDEPDTINHHRSKLSHQY